MKKIGILTSWKLYKNENDDFLISNTQYLYLEYLIKTYDYIYLICPVYSGNSISKNLKVLDLENLDVLPLPGYKNYIDALKYYREFKNQIRLVKDKVDFFYCTAPDPFCWLPSFMKKTKENILHFVSDIIEVTKTNIKLNWFSKSLYILGYLPEYLLTIFAAKRSCVYINGKPLSVKLKKIGVQSTVVISSTIREIDLISNKELLNVKFNRVPHFLYVGYLRNSKGLDTIMNFISLLINDEEEFQFNIVGIGDMYSELKDFIENNNVSHKVHLLGRIDDRKALYSLMRNSDVFLFPSLSEGSPRVVIEAMSQGLLVLSTPVGSLPTTFKDGEEILFFDFNNAEMAYSKFMLNKGNSKLLFDIRKAAYTKVCSEFTIEKFLNTIFNKYNNI